jgi:hypothetical protein
MLASHLNRRGDENQFLIKPAMNANHCFNLGRQRIGIFNSLNPVAILEHPVRGEVNVSAEEQVALTWTG